MIQTYQFRHFGHGQVRVTELNPWSVEGQFVFSQVMSLHSVRFCFGGSVYCACFVSACVVMCVLICLGLRSEPWWPCSTGPDMSRLAQQTSPHRHLKGSMLLLEPTHRTFFEMTRTRHATERHANWLGTYCLVWLWSWAYVANCSRNPNNYLHQFVSKSFCIFDNVWNIRARHYFKNELCSVANMIFQQLVSFCLVNYFNCSAGVSEVTSGSLFLLFWNEVPSL